MVYEKGGGIIGKKLETGKITQWKKIANSENKRQEKKERILDNQKKNPDLFLFLYKK